MHNNRNNREYRGYSSDYNRTNTIYNRCIPRVVRVPLSSLHGGVRFTALHEYRVESLTLFVWFTTRSLKLLINYLFISARVCVWSYVWWISGLLILPFPPAGWVTIYFKIMGYDFNILPKVQIFSSCDSLFFYTLIKLIIHLSNTYCLLIKVLNLKVTSLFSFIMGYCCCV